MASTGSSAAIFLLLEVLAIKLAFYMLAGQNPSPPILDLAAYSGYKCDSLLFIFFFFFFMSRFLMLCFPAPPAHRTTLSDTWDW